ncbi:hypothetical protein ABVK25_006936 [Lepraria finkii]|uniref:Peptidase A1 domain-containing protein n=1 Tax=Lepraria finkii TaxID=1340010 RepID=A0ABR4B756_9LECA
MERCSSWPVKRSWRFVFPVVASSGSLLFGGVDTEKYSGSLISLPTSGLSDPSLHDLEVQLTSLTISDSSGTSSLTPRDMALSAWLDSGTTQMLLPNSIVEQITQHTGAVEGFFHCNLSTRDTILTFGFGDKDGAHISVPMSGLFMSYVGDTFFADGTEVCELGASGQPASDEVILGDTFLRSAYVEYDLDTKGIWFAHAKWDAGSASNIVEIDKENPMLGAKDELALLSVPNPSSASSTEPAPNQAAGASDTALASGPHLQFKRMAL